MKKRLNEILDRKKEIRSALETCTAEELQKFEEEIEKLNDEQEDIEKRTAIIEDLNNKELEADKVIKKEERSMLDANVGSKEYRTAYFENIIKGKETEIRTAFAGGKPIPTLTLNKIVEKVKVHAKLLDKIELYNIPGNLSVNIEDTVKEAGFVNDGATISESADSLRVVNLVAYGIKKLIRVPSRMLENGIDAVEDYVVKNIANSVIDRINLSLIGGTGSSQPTGLEKVATWEDGTNAVQTEKWTYDNVLELIGLAKLVGGENFVMSTKTLFGDFMGLTDAKGNKLVAGEGGQYKIHGFDVVLDSRVNDGATYFGNIYNALVGNFSIENQIKVQYDIDSDSVKFLGVAYFDSKVKDSTAIVKGFLEE